MCECAWAYLKTRMADSGVALQSQVLDARFVIRGSSNA